MKKVILLKTTKVNGDFVAGGTILEIGKDIEKEDFESLKKQGLATEDLGIKEVQSQVSEKDAKIAELEKQIELLKAELEIKQRNENPRRLNEGMRKLVQDMHEVADAIEGSTWRIQRKARVNGKWVTLKGSYWNEARAEDALAALPNKKGGWWRIIEVKS